MMKALTPGLLGKVLCAWSLMALVACDDGESGKRAAPGGSAGAAGSGTGTAAAILVAPTEGLAVSETGTVADFSVVLNVAPTADVEIPLSSGNAAEGTLSASRVVFSPTNWNTPQLIQVTGVDDALVDGPIGFLVVTAPAVSTDASFAGLDAPDVSVTNADDDRPGIELSPRAGLVTTETGESAQFTARLTSRPSAPVTLKFTSSDLTEGTVSPAELVLAPEDWDVGRRVTVTGVDDEQADRGVEYQVLAGLSTSDDPGYAGLDAGSVTVTNVDDDSAGFLVAPSSGLTTTEGGATDTFTIALTTAPTSDVTLSLASSDATEGSVSPSQLVFTAVNWNAPQAVKVTGLDDPDKDGDQLWDVTGTAASADADYAGVLMTPAHVRNVDDESAGVIVLAQTAPRTTEAAGTATVTLRLSSRPKADVTVGLRVDDATEGAVNRSSVTITPADWDAEKVLTLTGVDDQSVDGDQTYRLILDPLVSGDPDYAGLDPEDLAFVNADDDMAGLAVSSDEDLKTTEWGGTAEVRVALNSRPDADVTVPVAVSDDTEGHLAVSSLTFTPDDWKAPKTVVITGQDDALADGAQPYKLRLGPTTSSDAAYADLSDAVDVSNTDNDSAGFTVLPVSGLKTTEDGEQATFDVRLNSEPTANVVVAVASLHVTEAVTSETSLTFTPDNWSALQRVTVTGRNDDLADGEQGFVIALGPVTSTDAAYAALDPVDVTGSNLDNDSAGIKVAFTPATGLTTTEAAGTATFTVVLTSQPTASVSIGVSSSAPTEGKVSASSVDFTTTNWASPQTVTVTGQDDSVADGNQPYTILLAKPNTTDAAYAAIDPTDVPVTNTDNDSAGVTVSPTSKLTTGEDGTKASFTVKLNSQPKADVNIKVKSLKTTEATVSASSLDFTTANWNAPQTVTVTGVDDAKADGGQLFTIEVGPVTSTDTAYSALDPSDVTGTNVDNDTATAKVTLLGGQKTTEGGGQTSFSVVLGAEPSADVTFAVSTDGAEATTSTQLLRFTPSNWGTAQTVTVTGVDDSFDDGDVDYLVVLAAGTSSDPSFHGLDPADVSLVNVDDDTAGVTIAMTTEPVTKEDGTLEAAFTVRLDAAPRVPVTIPLTSLGPDEGMPSPSSLTFTSQDWSTERTIIVRGVDDSVWDKVQAFDIQVGAVSAMGDASYDKMGPWALPFQNLDDDRPTVTVKPTSGLVTGEDGTRASFTVVLDYAPTQDVTIEVHVSDDTEGSVSLAQVTVTGGATQAAAAAAVAAGVTLSFTPTTWSAPQQVVVDGVKDSLVDGEVGYTIIAEATKSADADFDGLDVADVSAVNRDDDKAAIVVSPASLTTGESDASGTFWVSLGSQPLTDVVLSVESLDPSEGMVSGASLTFAPDQWNVPQSVYVYGVDDAEIDGDITYSVLFTGSQGSDSTYVDVKAYGSVTNLDNEVNVKLVSLDPKGQQFPHCDAGDPDISADGQRVVFTACLTGEGTTPQVYLRQLGEMGSRLISRSAKTPAQGGNAASQFPVISDDGAFVAFMSQATDLLPAGDPNGAVTDIYVYDVAKDALVARLGDDTKTQFHSFVPRLSTDGRTVGFYRGDMVAAGSGIHVALWEKGQQWFVSLDATGAAIPPANLSPMFDLSVQGDPRGSGTLVLSATGVLSDSYQNPGAAQIWALDLPTAINQGAPSVTLVSWARSRKLGASGDSRDPTIAQDRGVVAFESQASDLGDNEDTGQYWDVFVADMETGDMTCASMLSSGEFGTGDSRNPAISPDGNYVAFQTTASNFGYDTNEQQDVYGRDLATLDAPFDRISLSYDQLDPDGLSGSPYTRLPLTSPGVSCSRGGASSAYTSQATNLVPGDTNGGADVFLFTKSGVQQI